MSQQCTPFTTLDPDRLILVTGGSGVVGQALLPLLPDRQVINLVHRSHPGGRTVHGNLRRSRLGLSAAEYHRLVDRVDTVVHCAAVTDFSGPEVTSTNVDGTARVAEFAAAAGAHLLHVSTAFVGVGDPPAGTEARRETDYARSKIAGEQAVRASGARWTIARPSIVIGDSRTGVTSRYQSVYQVAGAVVTGRVPIAPVDPGWFLDVIPQDLVARALVALLDGSRAGNTLWLTAGPDALTLAQTAQILTDLAARWRRPVSAPRFVDVEMYHRLIAPVFLSALPAGTRTQLTRLVGHLSTYMAAPTAFPSDVPELLGWGPGDRPDPGQVWARCLRRWAADRRLMAAESGDAVPSVDTARSPGDELIAVAS